MSRGAKAREPELGEGGSPGGEWRGKTPLPGELQEKKRLLCAFWWLVLGRVTDMQMNLVRVRGYSEWRELGLGLGENRKGRRLVVCGGDLAVIVVGM